VARVIGKPAPGHELARPSLRQLAQVGEGEQDADRGADLKIGRRWRFTPDQPLLGQLVDVVELGWEPGQVVVQLRRRDPVVAPARVHVGDREVGTGTVKRPGSTEGSHRFGPEMQRPPRQPPPQILELLVAPALGFADRVGDRRRKQRWLGGELLQPRHDRP